MEESKPLCVDLDGTLVLTDTMWEAFFSLLKNKPWAIVHLLKNLPRGRARMKHEIAVRTSLTADVLPYNIDFLAWLREQKKRGRKLYLVTGSNEKFAQLVAQHLGIFDDVIGSTHTRVMSGADKAVELVGKFGERGFAYAGNSRADLLVWQHCNEVIIVNASSSTATLARALGRKTLEFTPRRLTWKTIMRAIRWHQWAKNILIFVPVLTAHQLLNVSADAAALFAFTSFCAIASAVYLMNDLADISADRQNKYKKYRPIASGNLPIPTALWLALALGAVSVLIGLNLPTAFLNLLLLYILINSAYSLALKRLVGIDVLVITSLYVLRILAGSAVTNIATSPWLFAFAALVFLSLALVKRVSEISNLKHTNQTRAAGRGYTIAHERLLTLIGQGSGALSLAVLGLYIQSPAVQILYRTPGLLWLLVPLFGISLARIWKETKLGNMHEDPTVFAAKDPMSYATALAVVIIVVLAT